MLSWEEYFKKGVIRRIQADAGVVKSLIKISDANLKTISKLKLDEETHLTIFKNYYDSLREICEAVALLRGYKIYQHEAVGLFLREILKEESIFYKFDRFRIMRNGLIYYGRLIEFNETKQAIEDIKEMIKFLKNKYINNLKNKEKLK